MFLLDGYSANSALHSLFGPMFKVDPFSLGYFWDTSQVLLETSVVLSRWCIFLSLVFYPWLFLAIHFTKSSLGGPLFLQLTQLGRISDSCRKVLFLPHDPHVFYGKSSCILPTKSLECGSSLRQHKLSTPLPKHLSSSSLSLQITQIDVKHKAKCQGTHIKFSQWSYRLKMTGEKHLLFPFCHHKLSQTPFIYTITV